MLLNVQQDSIIMIRKIPGNVLPFRTRLDNRPDIGLPRQFVLRQGTEIAEDADGVLIEAGGERAGHGEEPTTEAPMNTVYMERTSKGPATWNRKFGKASLDDLLEFVEKALFVFHNFENAVIHPKKSLRIRMFQRPMNHFHLGVHQGVELLRVLLWSTMRRKSTLIRHRLLVTLQV